MYNFYFISVHMYVCGVYECCMFVSAQLWGSECAYACMLSPEVEVGGLLSTLHSEAGLSLYPGLSIFVSLSSQLPPGTSASFELMSQAGCLSTDMNSGDLNSSSHTRTANIVPIEPYLQPVGLFLRRSGCVS